MEFIADVQGYSIPNFIPKEIAVLSCDGRQLVHIILKPPCSLQELSKKAKININWLFHEYHGLAWQDGFVETEEAEKFLKKILHGVPKLYVKGHQKQEYFQRFYDGEIVNLESESSMKNYLPQQYCYMHKTPFVCSLNNVHILKLMLDKKNINDIKL